MIFKKEQFERAVKKDFPIKYKQFSEILNNAIITKYLFAIFSNKKLMQGIIFSNDFLSVPPVKTFVSICETQGSLPELSNQDKKSLGAIWGFIFMDVLKYQKKTIVTCTIKNFRTASKYTDPIDLIDIEE